MFCLFTLNILQIYLASFFFLFPLLFIVLSCFKVIKYFLHIKWFFLFQFHLLFSKLCCFFLLVALSFWCCCCCNSPQNVTNIQYKIPSLQAALHCCCLKLETMQHSFTIVGNSLQISCSIGFARRCCCCCCYKMEITYFSVQIQLHSPCSPGLLVNYCLLNIMNIYR